MEEKRNEFQSQGQSNGVVETEEKLEKEIPAVDPAKKGD
jgi:hypothetical protein